jgi:methyl-accepting chemotaxis protein
MKPIDGFFELLENRTREEVLQLKKQQEIIIYLIISKPLKKFVIEDRIMQKVGEGDLTIHASETSDDEVGIIMKEFNKMVDSQSYIA